METFDVAHLHEQGVDLIIVWVAPFFGSMVAAEQERQIAALTLCAHKAGLAGTVVPVWPVGDTFAFRAPKGWHPFFFSLDLATLAANVNKTLSCG